MKKFRPDRTAVLTGDAAGDGLAGESLHLFLPDCFDEVTEGHPRDRVGFAPAGFLGVEIASEKFLHGEIVLFDGVVGGLLAGETGRLVGLLHLDESLDPADDPPAMLLVDAAVGMHAERHAHGKGDEGVSRESGVAVAGIHQDDAVTLDLFPVDFFIHEPFALDDVDGREFVFGDAEPVTLFGEATREVAGEDDVVIDGACRVLGREMDVDAVVFLLDRAGEGEGFGLRGEPDHHRGEKDRDGGSEQHFFPVAHRLAEDRGDGAFFRQTDRESDGEEHHSHQGGALQGRNGPEIAFESEPGEQRKRREVAQRYGRGVVDPRESEDEREEDHDFVSSEEGDQKKECGEEPRPADRATQEDAEELRRDRLGSAGDGCARKNRAARHDRREDEGETGLDRDHAPARQRQTFEEEAGAAAELHRDEEMANDENREGEKVGETLTDAKKDPAAAAVGARGKNDHEEDKTAQRRE